MAVPKKAVPVLLLEVEKNYAKAQTLIAEYSEIDTSAATGIKKTKTGIIQLKHPDKVRWEEKKPDHSLTISDGKTFWHYTPPFEEGEPGRVVTLKSSQVQSRLANALLAGKFSSANDARITAGSGNRFVILPKPGSAGSIARAEVEIDSEKKLVQKVILDHKGGNHSEITLTKIDLGKPLSDELFSFTAPPNTEKENQ